MRGGLFVDASKVWDVDIAWFAGAHGSVLGSDGAHLILSCGVKEVQRKVSFVFQIIVVLYSNLAI